MSKMLEEIMKENKGNTQEYKGIKKIRACPYYSPFKATCVNHNHPGYDEGFPSRFPRCGLRGKYSECSIVDKVIELTLDTNNSVIHREYLYIKGRINLTELDKNISDG